jgi:enterochelin esterase-like enzyme
MLHGLGSNDDQWIRIGIDQAADRLISSKQLPPFLIVMPYDVSWGQPNEDPFDEALIEELIPAVDVHYATRASSSNRAVGGLSRGAAWALHLGLTYPEIFGAIGAHSLPIFWADTGLVPKMLAAVPPGDMPRIYLDIGRGDPELSTVEDFEALLAKQDILHEWHLNNGYHEEAYWSAHLEQYLRWYAEGWK